MDDTIKVALRVRPLSVTEQGKGCQSCLNVIPQENQVQVLNTDKAFTYNYVFGPESGQPALYEKAVQSLVKQLFKGYNVTILAYGQTGSGKTYSMGTCYTGEGEMGIIPRAISEIFELISQHADMEFKVTTSFMELYKEQLYDLLAASNKPRDQCVVDIREDNKGIRIPGLTEMLVENAADTTKTLILGSEGRVTGATAMNAVSSRSHAIFTITINMCKKNNQGGDMIAKFHLVDLAGSERPKKTMATGERFKEGVNINRGLLALGNVISALGEGAQKSYIGYRDSKLTRLLQDSLGGNSMTLMIACVSPADYNLEETLSTLRYADRAKHIKNKPVVNQDPRAAELARLHKEVAELRLALMTNGGSVRACPKEHENLAEEIAELNAKNRKMTEALHDALGESTNMAERALLAEMARDRMSIKLAELQAQCNLTVSIMDQTADQSSHSLPDVWKEQLAGLKALQTKISEVHAEQKRGHAEILSHQVSNGRGPQTAFNDKETNPDSSRESGELTPLAPATPASPATLAEFQQQEETHTLQQAELNQELRELTRALALKEELASKLAANSHAISANLRQDYEENVKQLESQISQLIQEKENLMQTLKTVQENHASNKISEQRRKRLQELEQLIQNLKKKVVEQTRVIKIKEKNDEKIIKLDNEIKSMKMMKVRLIRQMRQEGERFRIWKAEREKEVLQLKEKERKRINQMSKMETMHAKQQNVLKRKFEEAAAANKRLKDALALQKQTQEKRMTLQGKAERIQSWVVQELNVLVSTIDAERARDKLIEDRSVLQAEMNVLQESLERADDSEKEQIQERIVQLTEELSVRSFQIAELNQKILDSDQENKSRTRWENVQSMAEAKCALKHVFELAAEMRKDFFAKESKMEELEEAYKKTAVQLKLCEVKLREESQNHRSAVDALEEECADKVAVLLRRLEEKTPSDLQRRIEELEQENKRLREAKEELEELRLKVDSLRKDQNRDEDVPMPRAINKFKNKPHLAPPPVFMSPDIFQSDDEFEHDDHENDPDWTKTPIFQRLQKMKRKTVVPEQSKLAVKRSSDGQTICECRGLCVRFCSCKSSRSTCSDHCQCNSAKCKNRTQDSESTMETVSEDDVIESSQEKKKPRRKAFQEMLEN